MSASSIDRLRTKRARQITVGIFLDESPADRLDAAVLNRQQARQLKAPDEDLAALDESVTDAQRELDEATFWFTFRGIGRTKYAALVAEHPPTGEDIAKASALRLDPPDYHAATFTPALLSVSCIAPVLSLDTVNSMFEDEAWNVDELGALFAAALAVNVRARPLRVRVPPDPRSGSDVEPVT